MSAENTPRPTGEWLLACLCAGWCNTCEAYRPVMQAVAAAFPALRCVWIDIETHSDALGDEALDIENFPTVMFVSADGATVAFFGTVLPHQATLERLVQSGLAGRRDAPLAPPGLAQAVANLARTLPAL